MASTPASSSPLRTIHGRTTASSFSAATDSSFPMRRSWPWKRRFCTTPRRRRSPILTASRHVEDNPAFQSDYIQFLIDCVPGLSLSGLKIVADCANGAAAAIAPELLRRLNRRPTRRHYTLNTAPDGRNINANCGALHPEFVAREVKARGADLGVTFDGDADRCMLADASGNVINGDAILLDGRARFEGPRPVDRRRCGGHNHVEHGTGSRAQAQRHSHVARAGWRPLRARR